MGGVVTAALDEPPRGARFGLSFERMAIGLLFVAVAFRALLMPAQNDTFWHLRAGADIWRTGHVALTDSYSFTASGLPWPDHEWLWQVLIYSCHQLGGMPLVSLAAAAFVIGAVLTVYRLMVGPRITRFILMAVGLAPASCVWVLRPQIVTLAALVLLMSLLARERYRLIPPLFIVWANFHGGVMFGGFVLVAALGAAALRWGRARTPVDRRRLVTLALLLPLAGAASCATPLGLGIFGFVWESTSRLSTAQITEWAPTLPNGWLGGTFWMLSLAFVVLLFVRRNRLTSGDAGSWPDRVILAAALALFPFAFRSLRNIAPFLLVAVPAASRLLGAEFHFRLPTRATLPSPNPDRPLLNLVLLGCACATLLAVVAVAWSTAPKALNWRPIGIGALAAVRSCDGPLYNRYDDGGYLIWFAPTKRVFVDSRKDPYPLAFVLHAIAVENGEESYRPSFDRWGIRCAFLPVSSAMALRLRGDGWQSRFHDQAWDVLASPTAAPPSGDGTPEAP